MVAHVNFFYGALTWLVDESDHIAFCEFEAVTCHFAYAELRTLQVGQDTNMYAELLVDVANPVNHLQMVGMGAVREVQAESIHAGLHEFHKRFCGSGCRSYGGYNLGAAVFNLAHVQFPLSESLFRQ